MEIVKVYQLFAIWLAFVLIKWAWTALNWVWLRPRKLERRLRQQGLVGNPYRLLHGDLKEMSKMSKEAKSRPINIDDDILPRIIPFVHQTISNYGKNSFVWFGPVPRVNIMNPELIKEVFLKFHKFQKRKINLFASLLASGLVTYEGEKWVKHRKLLSPAFSPDKLKEMLPAFHLSCSDMVSKWEEMVSAEGSCELDIWPHLQNLTSDAISRTAFGNSFEDGRKIFQLQKQLIHLIMESVESVFALAWKYLPTKRNKRMKMIDKEIQGLLKDMINKRETAMKAGETAEEDLLGILLKSNFREIQEKGNSDNTGMSINEVIEECKLFYFAGQETTSNLLVWTLILLSKHQNWQALARKEVLEVFGSNKPDFGGLNHLKVVTMIFNEVLRLYPPAVILTRTLNEDTKLGEMNLPAGVQISLPTILLHHEHEIWGDDAKEFKPERFSQGVSKATRTQISYFPFGWGPRVCIGQNFAMIEAKMALAMILQRFSFELSPSYAHAPSPTITLQPQYGAHLILHRL